MPNGNSVATHACCMVLFGLAVISRRVLTTRQSWKEAIRTGVGYECFHGRTYHWYETAHIRLVFHAWSTNQLLCISITRRQPYTYCIPEVLPIRCQIGRQPLCLHHTQL
ncbi:hypothetical protein BKA82DRAFT_4063661, partial [Pisolithus tinctorius]